MKMRLKPLSGLFAALASLSLIQRESVSDAAFMQLPAKSFSVGSTLSPWNATWIHDSLHQGEPWEQSCRKAVRLAKRMNGDQPPIVRVPIQWRDVVGEEGFSKVDRLLAILVEEESRADICVGIKVPRWPESYVPDSLKALALKPGERIAQTEFNTTKDGIGEEALDFIRLVIARYANQPVVIGIQIENEPLEPFGEDRRSVPFWFLEEEVRLVRSLVGNRLSLSVTFGAGLTDLSPAHAKAERQKILNQLITLPVDRIGLNVYQSGKTGRFLLWEYGFDASADHWWMLRDFVQQIEAAGKIPFIAELQIEPWQASPAEMNFADPHGNSSLSPDDYAKLMQRVRRLGVDYVYLWGFEFTNAAHPQWNKALEQALKQ